MTTSLNPIDALSPGQSLSSYLQAIGRIPLLSPEEERQLAERLRHNSDVTAARQLVMSHLRFVAHISSSYLGYGLPQSDLIQEGNVGLMKAVKRFDPSRGVRLITFAVHWIKAEIHDFILRNWRMVKIATTKAQRKLFFNLRGKKKSLSTLTEKEVIAIAEDLNVKPSEVRQMEQRLATQETSFDTPMGDEEPVSQAVPSLMLSSPESDPARIVECLDAEKSEHSALHAAVRELDARSRDILTRRWLAEERPTLQALASEYGVSIERVRQIESAAMEKVRSQLERH